MDNVTLNENFWFKNLILMFQKEVADRIVADFNTIPQTMADYPSYQIGN